MHPLLSAQIEPVHSIYQVNHGISDLDMPAAVDALYHKYTRFVYIFSLFSNGKEPADPARGSQIIFIVTIHSQCHLLKQISVKTGDLLFLYP